MLQVDWKARTCCHVFVPRSSVVKRFICTLLIGSLGTYGFNATCPTDYHSGTGDPDWVNFGNKCYRDATPEWGVRFWEFCTTTCRDLYCDEGYCSTATLVTIESAAEESFLEAQFPSDSSCCGDGSSGTSCCKWIGLGWVSAAKKSHRLIPAVANEDGGSWRWQSERIPNYRNWAAGQPKDNEGCAVLGASSDGWVAESCDSQGQTNKHRCICEISLGKPTTTTANPTAGRFGPHTGASLTVGLHLSPMIPVLMLVIWKQGDGAMRRRY